MIDRLIEELEPVLRDEILKDFASDSCVASSRILADLLHEAGMQAWTFPVEVLVANRAYATRLAHEGPPDLATFSRWHEESGAEVVSIGHGVWPGHLVLLTEGPEGIALWDPSINQTEYLSARFALPKLLVLTPVEPAFLAVDMPIESRLQDGTMLRYTAQQAQGRPRLSTWAMDEDLVAQVEARIRERLRCRSGRYADAGVVGVAALGKLKALRVSVSEVVE